jgi:hypothetical protein
MIGKSHRERNMQNLRRYQQAWWTAVLLAVALSVGPFASGARAQTTNMTEHGFCGASAATSTCTDNNTITPTTNTLGTFGFTRSPDDNSGLQGTVSFDLVVLVPTNDANAGTQTFDFNATHTGTASGLLVLHSGTFTAATPGGDLTSFLGLTCVPMGCGPNNPFSGFLAGETNQKISGVMGFDVYTFNFGSVSFKHGGSTDPTFTPDGSIFNGNYPTGAEIYSFLDETPGTGNCPASASNCIQDATALSATLIVVPNVITPDGGMTLMLLGGAFVGLATLRQRFTA